MKVNGKNYTSIWLEKDGTSVCVIDQTCLPHKFRITGLSNFESALAAINTMVVRGAPLIGVTAAFALYLASLYHEDPLKQTEDIQTAAGKLKNSRPTAIDLFKAVDRILNVIENDLSVYERTQIILETALTIRQESIDQCRQIGLNGLELIRNLSIKKRGGTVNILTHCNAGWLATVDYGTALAPVYLAFENGISLHIWVDETRPRNQGAGLTAWELLNHGIPHTLVADNTGGHLMQHGLVDLVIVGTDRTTRRGDVANKIGTYLKALSAGDNRVPFYVAAPTSSIDFSITDGLAEIPIEQRNEDEVKYISGLSGGKITKVLIAPEKSHAANYGFDVTPARLITGLITERGICEASEKGLLALFPEMISIR